MNLEAFTIIIFTAIPVGILHTLFGPDHYVPFIALAKAHHWSLKKTTWITLLCGIGHVLSAVILGIIAIAIGLSLTKIKVIEDIRGELAAWILIIFGLLYLIWSLRALVRQHHHTHPHSRTLWILFIIFILGPCEPLIPLILYPAIQGSMWAVFLVSLAFGLATIATMLTVVILTVRGMHLLQFKFLEKYANVIAGSMIFMVGIAIKIFNL